MHNVKITEFENKIIIENIENFNLSDIFDCGQCFRFNKFNNKFDKTAGSDSDLNDCVDFEGVAFGKYLRVSQNKNTVYFETTPEDFNDIWRGFFDIDRDYKKIFDTLRQDDILKKASDFCPGIRILKQDPFECLISFIFSQNNNIPRIKKIIERLCENFGEPVKLPNKIQKAQKGQHEDNKTYYGFPSAERIAGLTLDELDVLKAGFRTQYILDAAKQINTGEIDLEAVYNMTLREGADYLKQIRGVGDKIAACVLLFAYNKLDSFPVDVWIKKVIAKYYSRENNSDNSRASNNSSEIDYKKLFGEYAGIANAYLFYYERANSRK